MRKLRLPQVRMESQMAKIQIQSTPGKQEITQPKATVEIEQPKAELNINSKPAKLHIDQSQAWEDMNLLNVFKSSARFAAEGMSGVKEGIARRAEEGMAMMKIENQGTPLIDQAIQHSERPEKSLGIQFIPSHFSVKTQYEPGELNIDFKINKPRIQAQTHRPEINYTPGDVETSLKQAASLNIDYINLFDEKQ